MDNREIREGVKASERQLETAKRRVRVVILAIVALGVLALGALGLLLAPYSPLVVHDIDLAITNGDVCPDETTRTIIDYTLRFAPEEIEAEPIWVARNVPGVPDGYVQEGVSGKVPASVFMTGERDTLLSPVLRLTPMRAGEWEAGSIVTAYGSRLRLPVSQKLTVMDGERTQVLPPTHPRCEESP